MRRHNLALVIGCSVSAAALALSSCGSSGSSGGISSSRNGIKDVTFVLTSPEADAHTAYYSSVPNYLGYWKQEGLNVHIQLTGDSTAGVEATLSGKAFMTNAGMSGAVALVPKAPNLRVVGLDVAKNFYGTVVPADSKIESYKELAGKNVGVQSLGSASYFVNRAAVKAAGGNPDSVQWIPVGIGAQAAHAMQTGQIAAYAGYDGPIAGLQNLGLKLRTLPSPLSSTLGNFAGEVVTSDTLKNDPKDVVGMVRGIDKALVFCRANIVACVKIHYKVFPDSKPKGVSEDEAIRQGANLLQARLNNAPPDPDGRFNVLHPQKFNALLDFFYNNKITKDRPNPSFVDQTLVSQFNNFNKTAIMQQAKNFGMK